MPPVRTAKKNSSANSPIQPPRVNNSGRADTKDSQSTLTELWAPRRSAVGGVSGSGSSDPTTPQSSAESRPAPVEPPANPNAPLPEDETSSLSKPLSSSSSDLAPAPDPSPLSKPVDAVKKQWWSASRGVPASKGVKDAHFASDRAWQEGWRRKLGTLTKKLTFGDASVLTDKHIEQLASLGPSTFHNLTHFEFSYRDVSYNAHNANNLTDDAAVRLAGMCPGLQVVKLQGADGKRLTDATLAAFLANCPDLTSIELTGERAEGAVRAAFFDELRAHPEWAPELKKLRIPGWGGGLTNQAGWMKAMRALGKERETLVIELVSVSQVKKYGDWELETRHDTFKKGRSAPRYRYPYW